MYSWSTIAYSAITLILKVCWSWANKLTLLIFCLSVCCKLKLSNLSARKSKEKGFLSERECSQTFSVKLFSDPGVYLLIVGIISTLSCKGWSTKKQRIACFNCSTKQTSSDLGSGLVRGVCIL